MTDIQHPGDTSSDSGAEQLDRGEGTPAAAPSTPQFQDLDAQGAEKVSAAEGVSRFTGLARTGPTNGNGNGRDPWLQKQLEQISKPRRTAAKKVMQRAVPSRPKQA